MDPSSSAKRQRDSNSDDELEQPNCKRPKNDVFINYSYEDIGKQFMSHLQGAFSRNSITISDHTMLPVGQDTRLQLLKAIEESEIYVVVFSNNYASSVRSLDELVDIMDCLRKFDQRKVLPVFYKVEPSDVRSQEGSFKEAFQAHVADGKIDSKVVQKWKKALKDAGQLSGLTLQNRDEGQFVSKIVKQLEKMQSPQELHVADHPVVIGSRAEELISTLRLDCEDVFVVAVFGISGIGKTTIVKATYNKICSYFDTSCFLGDIHYRGGGYNWKIELQNLLISCLTQIYKFSSMHHHNDGVTKIRNLIRGRKILLVLDDVDNFEQLKSLGINPAWFYKGSRIIVITRDKQSLGNIPYTSYQIMLLNRRESFSLFNRLMLSRDNNHVNMKFIEEVAALAGGLPLVLEVWSRYFIGHERKQWPSLLEKLKRIPHGDVQKQLQMSYNSLSVTAKNLFLDIACFFVGMNKDLVVKVLHNEESAFFPDIEIQNLVDKFLVKDIDKNGFVRVAMNQVIREMGQEVIRQENVDEPGKRTRLINHRDIIRVFRDCSGTDSVRSIMLGRHKMEERATVQIEAFKKMSNLRFLQLFDREGKLQWSFSSKDGMSCYIFKHLKYLEWQWFPCKCLDNIDMANVVVIKLEYSKLEKLWDRVKTFKKLRILDVSWSTSLTKTGNFIGLDNLEELLLEGCENLKELDSSIGCLQKLITLNLSGCSQLKRLPWEMIGKLTSLQQLYLDRCPNLLEISHEVGSLTSLKHLGLWNSGFNSLPNSICQLHQLTKIKLSQCTNLQSIPDLPPSIEELYVTECINLVNLASNFSELQFMTSLTVEDCVKLGSEGFTEVTALRNLFELRMVNCSVSHVSSRIGNLVSLRFLCLSGNTFSSLPNTFSNLSQLQRLLINDCSQLQLLPPIPLRLKHIEAINCWSLDIIPFDSMKKAYIFPSKVFKESMMSTKGIIIGLPGEKLLEWCTYGNSGNVLSFVAPIQFDSKICGLILCATKDKDDKYKEWVCPVIYNKTKGTSHQFRDCGYGSVSMLVMFYPLNDTTLLVEAGDTVEVEFDDEGSVNSGGLRLIYEDDLVDSRLVLKHVTKPTLSLFPLSSEIMTGNSISEFLKGIFYGLCSKNAYKTKGTSRITW